MKTKTPKLWLINTGWLPDHEAYILCRAALASVEASLLPDETLHPIKVKLTNCCYGYRGRAAWWEIEWVGGRAIRWQRILVRIGKPDRFPCAITYWKFKNMPEYEFKTYREALVGVTAHEIGHALGYSARKDGEFKCEMMAWDAVDYYRKHQVEIDADIAAHSSLLVNRALLAKQKETPEAKATARVLQTQALLAKWKRKQKLAANKVKKYTKALTRAQKRLPKLTTVTALVQPVETPVPALLAAMPPPPSTATD